MKINTPTLNTYIALVIAIPCLVLMALWKQGDLTRETVI